MDYVDNDGDLSCFLYVYNHVPTPVRLKFQFIECQPAKLNNEEDTKFSFKLQPDSFSNFMMADGSGKISLLFVKIFQLINFMFLVRQQVLKLYRNFLRTIRNTPENERLNLLQWLRKDFKDNKHHTDVYIIKTHIRNGENMLKELQQSLALSGRQETPP